MRVFCYDTTVIERSQKARHMPSQAMKLFLLTSIASPACKPGSCASAVGLRGSGDSTHTHRTVILSCQAGGMRQHTSEGVTMSTYARPRPCPVAPSHLVLLGRTRSEHLQHTPSAAASLGASLLPRVKMLEKTTSLKQFNTGQKRHILICTAMHLGYKFTQHNWKKKIRTMLLYLFHSISLIPSHLPFSASLNAAIYTHKQTITS